MNGVPLAVLVLAHDDRAMLERLCARLAPLPVFVHLDAKATDLASDILSGLAHVRVLPRRHAIHWAGFAMVQATLDLMAFAMEQTSADHLLLLSGHCYPVRPIDDLVALARAHDGADLIQMVPVGRDSVLRNLVGRHWRQRPYLPDAMRRRHPMLARADDVARKVRNRLARSIGRDFAGETGDLPLTHGSQWWCLSRATVAAVLAPGEDKSRLAKAMATAFAPDEMFFQTLIAASPRRGHQHGETVDRGDANLLGAPLTFVAPSASRWIEDGPAMRAAIVASGKYFVRKVRSEQGALLDWIDQALLSGTGAVTGMGRADGGAAGGASVTRRA